MNKDFLVLGPPRVNFISTKLAELNRLKIMKKNNLIHLAQSLVLLPVMSLSVSLGGISNIEIPQNVLFQKINIETKETLAFNQAIDSKVALQKAQAIKAEAIDAYFNSRKMPLFGLGLKMVLEAEKNNLDWRLLPAIAVRESSGGKNSCDKVDYNSFGWGSCKIGFKSNEEAIEIIAWNLGGNNPNTERHYDDKTTGQILRAYNPPSIVPKYEQQVRSIMKAIGGEDLVIEAKA